MSFQDAQSELLTTREAATVVDRSQPAVKDGIRSGRLPAVRELDGWRVTRADLLAWDANTKRLKQRRASRPWERVAELLKEYGSMSSQELGLILGRHEGNARK